MLSNYEISDNDMKKIREELAKSLRNYTKTISYMAGDAPIEVLGLSKSIQNILINEGCLRVYDLFDRDFTKIKGLGKGRIRDLTTCLDQFIAMSV